MREPENIRKVVRLGVDMIGFEFMPDGKRYVQMISSNAGILPDYAKREHGNDESVGMKENVLRVGVFADDMPQNIITRIYNYDLDYVQLDGEESAVMIDNLRCTVDPDIHKGLKVIKTIKVRSGEDVERWRDYEGHADMLLFKIGSGSSGRHIDLSLLDGYKGSIPFLIGGGISIDDTDRIKQMSNPMFAGININEEVEIEPALKDVDKIRTFVSRLKGYGMGI